jgi:hypothetical protein
MKLSERRIRVFPWLATAPDLNPNSFTWDDHEMDNSFLCDGNKDVIHLPDGWICLGWADGTKIPVRPKPLTIAVRFADEDGREFWCHVM